MKRTWTAGLTAVAFAAATAPLAAHAQQAPMVMPDPMTWGLAYEQMAFEAADTDGNNLISEGEFVRDAAAAFAGLDRDHDGKLTPAELGNPDPRQFARIDTNGDGYLTFIEVMTYKMKAFKAADKDGDGGLSFQEIVASVTAEESSH